MKEFILKYKYLLLVIFAKFFYSLTSIFSKLASKENFLSKQFCIYYILDILILAIYAILWQQALKKVSLSVAMLFKPAALILSILWANLFFDEKVGLKVLFGVALIILGIIFASERYE